MSIALGPGQIIASRYRIEHLLGAGGMGSVYRALQLPEEQPVALKLLVDEHMSGAVLERFEREVQALGRLVHPNTVRLLDSGRSERGVPFLVMELLEGSDLAVDLARLGPMRWDHALAVCREVLGSLAEAHDAGIVHRDIKPANVFLCAGSSWPRVKVLDFGIAGAAEPGARTRRLTLTGTVIGSAAYMSPEQAQGKPVAPATDLYALGAVLFEMLTGKPPFDGLVFTAQLLAKVMQPAPGLRAVCPGLDVPTALHTLVAELLERDPARRPGSARQLAERIEVLLGAASLPSLERASSAPGAAGPPSGPVTEAMLPSTADQGWAPPRTESEPPPLRARPQGALRLALTAPVPLAALFVWWTLRTPPAEPEQALASLPAPSQASGSPPGPSEPSVLERPDAAARRAGEPPEPALPVRSAPQAPSMRAPSPEATAAPVALGAGPTSVAAVLRAERAGELTPVQRNDRIAELRRQRYDARARAAAEYRAGRIGRRELRARQREIDRRFEGEGR